MVTNDAIRQLIGSYTSAGVLTKTASELTAIAQTDKRSVGPIQLDELRPLLVSRGVLGKLLRAGLADDNAANAYAYINSSNKTIRADQSEYAGQLDAMVDALAPLGVTADVKAEVIALGGGYLIAGVTEEQIQAVINGEARRIAAAELEQWVVAGTDAMRARIASGDLPTREELKTLLVVE